jgi:type I restriction enzyme S subunit
LPDSQTFLDDAFVCVREEKADALVSNLAYPGDLVFTQRGTLGQVGLIPKEARFQRYVISQSQMKLAVDETKADPWFVYYYFRHPDTVQTIKNHALTSGVPHINLGILKSLQMPLPPLDVQKSMVALLSAYDDRIENSRRRMALLEEAARQLYREWFVRLRFPGHEHARIVDGVPAGWESVPISNVCTVGRGGSPRPINNFMGGEVPWFKIGDATESDSPFVFDTKEQLIEDGVKKSVFLPPQELILSNSATCGIPYFTGVSGCIHDGWLYFKNLRRVSKWFFYCCLYEKQQEILMGIGEGATQKNLNNAYIGRQTLVLPASGPLINSFSDFVEPLFAQVFTLAQTVRALQKARDLLLPRLMSGEIAV